MTTETHIATAEQLAFMRLLRAEYPGLLPRRVDNRMAQLSVLYLAVQGWQTPRIAAALAMSNASVTNHLYHCGQLRGLGRKRLVAELRERLREVRWWL